VGIPPLPRRAVATFLEKYLISSVPSPERSHPPSLLSFGLDVRKFFHETQELSTGFGLGVLSEPVASLSYHMDETSLDLHLRPHLTDSL